MPGSCLASLSEEHGYAVPFEARTSRLDPLDVSLLHTETNFGQDPALTFFHHRPNRHLPQDDLGNGPRSAMGQRPQFGVRDGTSLTESRKPGIS